ncbi:MAG: GNAT family N-acetyltransferase [Cytophagales bacterium]|nr:MAG: GNAT family N-acetyltransferase [Cytophagales bacterium]
MEFIVQVATEEHLHYAETICKEMEESARQRGTGIAKRDPEYIRQKIREGKAVIAIQEDGVWAGFCYIETWSHGKYVANSGLIVNPQFRKYGLATRIKHTAFDLSREKYPEAKLFGLTTSSPVMKINSELGYRPVTLPELTDDEQFWKGCQSCVNYDILTRMNRKHCLCVGMIYDPTEHQKPENEQVKMPEIQINTATSEAANAPKIVIGKNLQQRKFNFNQKKKLFERWLRIKANILLKRFRKDESDKNATVKKQIKKEVVEI